jgi:hypothetical protein
VALYYLTKYALTQGVREMPRDAEIYKETYLSHEGVFTTEFYTDPGAAVGAARSMRDKKIASLKKQIKRLEGLAFNVDEIKKWGEK